ncbi:MAG: RHS repeat-associated core domain-containing protein [archaeon]
MNKLQNIRTGRIILILALLFLLSITLAIAKPVNTIPEETIPVLEGDMIIIETNITSGNETFNETFNETINETLNGTDTGLEDITGDVILEELPEEELLEPPVERERTYDTTIYIYGVEGMDIARVNGDIKYYHKDALGSVRATTDEYGLVKETSDFMPFGENLDENDDVFTFSEKEQDVTGLQYFGARFYDPELGRFMSPDPIREGTNHYAYVRNNPTNKIDPTGLSEKDADSVRNKPTVRMHHGYNGYPEPDGTYHDLGANAAGGIGKFADVVEETRGFYDGPEGIEGLVVKTAKVWSPGTIRAKLAERDLSLAEVDFCSSAGGQSSYLAGAMGRGSSFSIVYHGLFGNIVPNSNFKVISISPKDFGVSLIDLGLTYFGLGATGGFVLDVDTKSHMHAFRSEEAIGEAFRGYYNKVRNTPFMVYYYVDIDESDDWDFDPDAPAQFRRGIGLYVNPHYNPQKTIPKEEDTT